ncbi:hypothetical protein [Paenibacillus sp. CF384]|uniref:hypothetical protein n=1 Tax=Paenibacillus sp. CF384 TaxID=1884382 RepID=UPI00089560FB|nr:hypothetical protein [Paenibacillus sp. CF384]SDX05176.1 hypothetical protein SAMN05518855_100866 [Paenibacillus sp. CF384]
MKGNVKHLILISLIVLAVTSCASTEDYRFNDRDIKISLISQEIGEEYRGYSIEVKNTGKLEISDLHFYMYYPIITMNGYKGNPFKIEGNTTSSRPVNL